MKIAIISTNAAQLTGKARDFLPTLAAGLAAKGIEIHLFADDAPLHTDPARTAENGAIVHEHFTEAESAPEKSAADLTLRLNELNPDAYLIWAAGESAWMALPFLAPEIATVAVGHADSEVYYAPARHYRAFLTRVVGTTPEAAVGFVISCVIDKERVEWISFDEVEATAEENDRELVETYLACLEKAAADAQAAPRESAPNFTPMKTDRPPQSSWFDRLKSKFMN